MDAPSGGGGSGRFRNPGPLGSTAGVWHGMPHPLAPAARYLAAQDAYSGLGMNPNVFVEERNGVFYVALSGWAAMRPFTRPIDEPFDFTVKRLAARKRYAVIINGGMFADNSNTATSRPEMSNYRAPANTQQSALAEAKGVARDRGTVLGGLADPQTFFISWADGPLGGYTFGAGPVQEKTQTSIGGLGPVIFGGMKYGTVNRYRKGVPEGAALSGEPEPRHRPYLEVRGNNAYKSFAERLGSVGKVIIGFATEATTNPLRIVVQPNGVGDTSLDEIRDQLWSDGVRNAVFLDGSDSAMLFANGKYYVHQPMQKDLTTKVAIGFEFPLSHIDPPGRSMGHIA
jgi:hypothetical protein